MSERSEVDCVSNDLVERVARALSEDRGYDWDKHVNFRPAFRRMARAAIAVLRPVLRAEAFEEAAKVAEAFPARTHGNLASAPYAAAEQAGDEIAAAIRALVKDLSSD